MKSKGIIRVEANSSIGMGHAMRAFSLCEMLLPESSITIVFRDMPEKTKQLLLETNRDFGLFHSLSRFLPFIHKRIPEHFSSGQKRLISLLHNISLSPNGSTILIDEPELSMHIDWQEKMVSALIESFPKHKFILATHAPSMVKDHHDLIFQVPPSDDT